VPLLTQQRFQTVRRQNPPNPHIQLLNIRTLYPLNHGLRRCAEFSNHPPLGADEPDGTV